MQQKFQQLNGILRSVHLSSISNNFHEMKAGVKIKIIDNPPKLDKTSEQILPGIGNNLINKSKHLSLHHEIHKKSFQNSLFSILNKHSIISSFI